MSVEGEPEPKRRKRNLNDIANGDDAEDSAENPGGAIYPQHVKANIHLRQIQDRNKREFEQLVQYCVRVFTPGHAPMNKVVTPNSLYILSLGQDQTVSRLVDIINERNILNLL